MGSRSVSWALITTSKSCRERVRVFPLPSRRHTCSDWRRLATPSARAPLAGTYLWGCHCPRCSASGSSAHPRAHLSSRLRVEVSAATHGIPGDRVAERGDGKVDAIATREEEIGTWDTVVGQGVAVDSDSSSRRRLDSDTDLAAIRHRVVRYFHTTLGDRRRRRTRADAPTQHAGHGARNRTLLAALCRWHHRRRYWRRYPIQLSLVPTPSQVVVRQRVVGGVLVNLHCRVVPNSPTPIALFCSVFVTTVKLMFTPPSQLMTKMRRRGSGPTKLPETTAFDRPSKLTMPPPPRSGGTGSCQALVVRQNLVACDQ